MKKYILTLFLLVQALTIYADLKMKSIDEIMNAEYSPATVIIANQRCSAVYLTAASLVEANTKTQHLSEEYQNKAKFMGAIAMFWSENNKGIKPISPEQNSIQISNMYDAYLDDGNKAKAKTGNFTDGILKKDMPSCNSLYETLSKELSKN